MTNQTTESYFITKDLYLAGLLYAVKDVEFIGINRLGQTCWFQFKNRNSCEIYQQQFFAKSIQVNAKDYAEALRTLKDLVFANG